MRAMIAACILAVGMSAAYAQGYPGKPVRMLVGFAPGGPTDLTARLTAQYLSEHLGQQFVVDNRPGAGGTVSSTILAHAAPDGYTISLAANGEMAISATLRPRLQYDPLRDFAPISRIGSSQLVLLVTPTLPVKSVKDLIALAKAKPGALNFASSGVGSTSHLSSELLKTMAGLNMVHVPYKGAGPAMAEVMTGQVQMIITGFSAALPHIRSGRLRALAVTGGRRLAAMPDLPTIGETVPGYEVTSWYGIFAPARTPNVVIEKLHGEIAAMVKKPEVSERLVALGIEPGGNAPQEFKAQIREEIVKWAKVIKAAGVPPQ